MDSSTTVVAAIAANLRLPKNVVFEEDSTIAFEIHETVSGKTTITHSKHVRSKLVLITIASTA
jgi:hypothetical protein